MGGPLARAEYGWPAILAITTHATRAPRPSAPPIFHPSPKQLRGPCPAGVQTPELESPLG